MELNLTYKVTEDAEFEVFNNDNFIGKMIHFANYWEFQPNIEKSKYSFYTDLTLPGKSVQEAKNMLKVRLSKIVELYNIL